MSARPQITRSGLSISASSSSLPLCEQTQIPDLLGVSVPRGQTHDPSQIGGVAPMACGPFGADELKELGAVGESVNPVRLPDPHVRGLERRLQRGGGRLVQILAKRPRLHRCRRAPACPLVRQIATGDHDRVYGPRLHLEARPGFQISEETPPVGSRAKDRGELIEVRNEDASPMHARSFSAVRPFLAATSGPTRRARMCVTCLLMLANRTNPDTGMCIPSHDRLARDCGMSKTTVKECVAKLEAAGLIEVLRRYNESVSLPNSYRLLMDEGVGRQPATKRRVETEKKTEKGNRGLPAPEGVSADIWSAFQALRKERRARH